MTTKQLLLWEEQTDDPIACELSDLRSKQNNLRRGIFQRYESMQKELAVLKTEILSLKLAMRDQNLDNYPLLRLAIQ